MVTLASEEHRRQHCNIAGEPHAGCTFFNAGDHGVWAAAPVTLLDSRFIKAVAPRGVAHPAAIKASGPRLRLQRLNFDRHAGYDVFVPADRSVTIFADAAVSAPGVGAHSSVSVVTFWHAPESLPMPGDEAFRRLREVRNAAERGAMAAR